MPKSKNLAHALPIVKLLNTKLVAILVVLLSVMERALLAMLWLLLCL